MCDSTCSPAMQVVHNAIPNSSPNTLKEIKTSISIIFKLQTIDPPRPSTKYLPEKIVDIHMWTLASSKGQNLTIYMTYETRHVYIQKTLITYEEVHWIMERNFPRLFWHVFITIHACIYIWRKHRKVRSEMTYHYGGLYVLRLFFSWDEDHIGRDWFVTQSFNQSKKVVKQLDRK